MILTTFLIGVTFGVDFQHTQIGSLTFLEKSGITEQLHLVLTLLILVLHQLSKNRDLHFLAILTGINSTSTCLQRLTEHQDYYDIPFLKSSPFWLKIKRSYTFHQLDYNQCIVSQYRGHTFLKTLLILKKYTVQIYQVYFKWLARKHAYQKFIINVLTLMYISDMNELIKSAALTL